MLKGVNLELEKGTCTAVVGSNGCGKKVLAAVLLGDCKKSAGRIEFSGKKMIRISEDRLCEDFEPDILCVCEVTGKKRLTKIGHGTHLLISNGEYAVKDICDNIVQMKDGKTE